MRREEWLDYLTPEDADLLEAEGCLQKSREHRKMPVKKWMVLLAACMLLAALSTAVLASQGKGEGSLFSWFRVSDDRERELFDRMILYPGASAEDGGYTIQAKEAAGDGKTVYAVLEITAPEDVDLTYVYSLDFVPMLLKKGDDRTNAEFLRGGWYTSVLEQPAQNRLSLLVSLEIAEKTSKKDLLLDISRIMEADDSQDRALAKGEWELVIPVSEYAGKTVRQLTAINCGKDTYYVTEVVMTPLGINVKAVKKIPLSVMGKTASWKIKSLFGTEESIPAGWSKSGFAEAPVSVRLKDKTELEVHAGGSSGSFIFCERSIQWQGIVDPEEIEEIRMENDVLVRQ